jgi:putative peptide zinc metalloprotease protein
VGKQPRPSELERRKQVRLRLRPNLVFTTRQEEGRTYHIVRDAVTLAHYRLDERQRYAVSLMDGHHTLAEIQEACAERFRPEPLALEELEAFASQLLATGLVQHESVLAGRFLFGQWQKHRGEVVRAALVNFLSVKVPLWNPDPFLVRLAPALRFLFTRWAAGGVLLLALAASALVATRWHDFVSRLPAYREVFTAQTVVYLALALGIARVLHEFGHGVCCKLQRGTVPEMGLLILVGCPTLYCNVSDSWSLPGKRQRLAVAAAGIYVDLLVAALATFVWWATDPGVLLHHACFGLMVVSGLGTLVWNANPLMRFDGYYLLSDWLEVPNLYERSMHFLQALCLRWLGTGVPIEPIRGRGRRLLFVTYALAAAGYRLLVTAGILYLLYTFLGPYRLGVVGFVLGTAAAVVLVGRPAWAVVRAARERGKLPEFKPARLWLLFSLGVLLLALFLTVPIPMHVEGQALLQVESDHVRRVVVPATGGFVSEVLVRDGQAVHAGDVLSVLTNPQLEIKLRVNEADQALRSRQWSGHVADLADAFAADGPAGAVPQTELELKALVREHALLREGHERLTLRAPVAGVVMGLAEDLKGRWLERGGEVCRVADPRSLRAVLLVEPADHHLIGRSSRAWLRAHGRGWRCWPGCVSEVAQVDARNVPPQLSSRAGGEVATDADPVSRTEKPRGQHYLVAVRLTEPDPLLQPGGLGRVKIETAPQTGWWRLRRYLAQAFGWGL